MSHKFAGDAHHPFLLLLDARGVTDRLLFGPGPEIHDEEAWQALQAAAPAWIMFDPFEGPVYQYLSWTNLDQATVERLLGAPLLPDDFIAEGRPIAFPRKWGVMF